jgi:hypothetical protein
MWFKYYFQAVISQEPFHLTEVNIALIVVIDSVPTICSVFVIVYNLLLVY